MAYIEFRNVKKKFGDKEVLRGIDLNLDKGTLVTLLGPSGCGKSTLLRCLAGLEEVSEGRIFLDGKDITDVGARDRAIGMVFQQYSLFPNMNVRENVAFGLKMKKVPKEEIRDRVDDILRIVGLEEQERQYPSQLSGGQQQRAALARALVTRPKVLLLDEPLSAIDALLRHSLQIEIRRIQRELGITAVFVTHDQDEAMVMSDQIHLMYHGRIEQSAAPMELYTRPVSEFAASFIGHYNLLDTDQFARAAEEMTDAGMRGHMAFRPELITMSRAYSPDTNAYHFTGKISVSLPHGNFIRYAVLCSGVQIDVDTLSGKEPPFYAGETVYLRLPREDVIEL